MIVVVVAALVAGCGADDAAEAPGDDELLVALQLDTDVDGLASAAASARDPSSGGGEFIGLEDVATSYGASQDAVDAAVAALGDLGVDVSADPSRAVLWGRVDVATAREAFGVELEVVELPGGGSAIEPDGTPHVPDGVPGLTGVVGLRGTTSPATEGGTTSTAPTPTPAPAACPDDVVGRAGLADAYGLADLLDTGATGEGVDVTLLEVDAFADEVFDAYGRCGDATLDASQVSESTVPLAPEAQSGVEVALDTVVVGLVAPGSELRVTRFDVAGSPVFPLLQVLTDSASAGGTPEVLLSTVGFCEPELTDAEIAMGEWLLSVLAATGTTTIASSGDDGSSACHPENDDPAVQYPASSAWATAVGGVTFSGSATRPTDLEVWNDTPDAQEGGGGGSSARVERPGWQTGTGQEGGMRVVPDLSAFAGPDRLGQIPTCADGACSWQSLGGTSLAASVVAGAVALGAQDPGGGDPGGLGLLAPLIAAAAASDAGMVTDVTSGDNRVFTGDCCSAAPGYDRASGWGVVDLSALVRQLTP